MTAEPIDPAAAALQELAWVRRLAYSLVHDAALADDVAQDAWLIAREQPPSKVESRDGLRAWLATVVQNRVRRLQRSAQRRRRREQVPFHRDSEDPADVAARAQLHHELTTAVMALEEPFRSALLWRYFDELPATEIARRQGIGHDAARQRIARGLAKLREHVARRHPDGFAGFCVAWTNVLGVPPAAVVAGWSLPVWFLMKKSILSVCAALGVILFWAWPASPPPPRPADSTPEAAIRVANVDRAEQQEPAAARTAAGIGVAGLVVAVVDESGRPRPDLPVLALRSGELVATSTTDAAGQAHFPAGLDADEWLFAGPACGVQRRPRGVEATGPVSLARGAAVEGRVRGEVPAEFVLELQHDLANPAFDGLGPNATAWLGAHGLTATTVVLPLLANGAFCGAGLVADWSGALRGPAGSVLREPSGKGAVENDTLVLLGEPQAGLVLEFVLPRLLRGRVLVAGAPVADLRVNGFAHVRYAGEILVRTAMDGRFELPVRDVEPDRALSIHFGIHDENGCLLDRSIEVPAGRGPHELGDFQVGKARSVVVREEEGAAVSAAEVALFADTRHVVRQQTDRDGRAHFGAVPAEARELMVTATGFATQRLPLPAAAEVAVTLRRSSALVVRVVAADGAPTGAHGGLVAAEQIPFRAAAANGAVAQQAFRETFQLDEHGEVALVDLLPGVPLHLEAVDELGDRLGALDVLTPLGARTERLVLTTTIRPARLSGLVTDERARPVPRARVHIEVGNFVSHARSDAQGRFVVALRRDAGTKAHVEVTHPAFVAWSYDGALGQDGGEFAVTLQRGRRLEVHVQQTSGAPLEHGIVLAELGAHDGGVGNAAGAGIYVFPKLARAAGEVAVVLGGQRFAVPVQPEDMMVVLRVPDLGVVTVHRDLAATSAADARLCVVVSRQGSDPQRHYFVAEGTSIPLSLPPGDYRLQLERRWLGQRRVELLGAARELAVRAAERTAVVLPGS